jgi:hypothetical protein
VNSTFGLRPIAGNRKDPLGFFGNHRIGGYLLFANSH